MQHVKRYLQIFCLLFTDLNVTAQLSALETLHGSVPAYTTILCTQLTNQSINQSIQK